MMILVNKEEWITKKGEEKIIKKEEEKEEKRGVEEEIELSNFIFTNKFLLQ